MEVMGFSGYSISVILNSAEDVPFASSLNVEAERNEASLIEDCESAACDDTFVVFESVENFDDPNYSFAHEPWFKCVFTGMPQTDIILYVPERSDE